MSSGSNSDSYGSPQAAPLSSPGSPRAPVSLVSAPAPPPSPQSSILTPQAQYGSGATNTFSSGSDPVIVDNSVPFSPSAQDTYSVAQPSPPVLAPAPAPDSYGGAQFPVLAPAPDLDTASKAQTSDPVILLPETKEAPAAAAEPVVLSPVQATTARSLTVDYSYDDYDPSDVPADQAAELPSYGISSTIAPESLDTYGVGSNSALSDDYDPSDVPADQVGISKVEIFLSNISFTSGGRGGGGGAPANLRRRRQGRLRLSCGSGGNFCSSS